MAIIRRPLQMTWYSSTEKKEVEKVYGKLKRRLVFSLRSCINISPLNTQCLHAIESGFFDTVGLFRPSNKYTANIALQRMELLGIEGFSQKLLRNVSASERRLCLLARALVKNPPLLILDEPCPGDLIDTICAVRNVTLIYVSHYQEEIPESVAHFFKLEKERRVE